MFRDQINAGLETIRVEPFNQIEAELGEAVARAVVAEIRPEHGAQQDVGEARRIGVAVLHAQIGHARDDEAAQIVRNVPGG